MLTSSDLLTLIRRNGDGNSKSKSYGPLLHGVQQASKENKAVFVGPDS